MVNKNWFFIIILLLYSCGPRDRTQLPKKYINVTTNITQNVQECPIGMLPIEGRYCPSVVQECEWYVTNTGERIKGKPTWKSRCGKYKKSKCLSSKKIHLKYCIDKYEYPNIKGEIPYTWLSWKDGHNICGIQGKRLCTDKEWTFACEGPDIKPYPYGDGYKRDKTKCNFDNVPQKDHMKMSKEELHSFFVESGSYKDCVSPFGVYDMVGNVDEFVINERGIPHNSGLKGGHVFGVRNRCRATTEKHNEGFSWYETGFRCCK